MKHTIIAFFMALVAMPVYAQSFDDEEDDLLSTERILTVTPEGERPDGPLRVRRRVGSLQGAALPHFGSPRVPVVLVEFPDRPFEVSGKTKEEVVKHFDIFFNSDSYAEAQNNVKSNGSVRRYFIDQSDSLFSPEFTILGPVMLDESYAFYGKNSGSNHNVYISTFYCDALTKISREGNCDWTQFDSNQDGQVDMVFFIFAGWGENAVKDFDPNAIWPQERPYSTSVTLQDGSMVRFACMGSSSEARYISKNQLEKDAKDPKYAPTGYNVANLRMDGIGTSIHELSHALGLPDLYDTSENSTKNFGMDALSVMDYGCYTYGGRFPCQYTAYERSFLEWKEMETLIEPCVVTIPTFSQGGKGYVVVNEANPNEYYILENRQADGWDEYTGVSYCRGLQVTHVDYDQNTWTSNRVNSTKDHTRMHLITANDRYIGASQAATSDEWKLTLQGALFPFNASYQDLTDETTPAARVYTGDFMHRPIRNITQNEDGSITLCYCTFGQLEAPEVEDATDIDEKSFTAHWQSVENATRYVVELYRDTVLVQVDTLVELSQSYTDLQPLTSLKYRVMAMADMPEDYIPSPWSEFSYLNTQADALATMPESEQWVEVYTLDGCMVSTCWADEIGRLRPGTGVYILRYPNGSTKKLLVR